ncbi:lasso peptide biosynthesis PqqD family chaperone [Cytobacillus horneckiae]|uniref:lasso peptide biosynthesis PqqD family chaperone n=1 Tax=Cytobacillus horneckiae TaxID=549687 RepID=UPI0020402763|nr:lasso peptide biosynthesis PqqD family chaperone [Cytobacillus horneckiae]MCM3180798.1 lasso peptide biosynthesis PqqD family chaperone [Cytobacillus horneckiae]
MNKENVLLFKEKVQQVKGNIVSDMGGEKVMLNIGNGKYYNLGTIGGDIWERMCEPVEIGQIIADLLNYYDVDREKCEEEVINFLLHLHTEKLIEMKCD